MLPGNDPEPRKPAILPIDDLPSPPGAFPTFSIVFSGDIVDYGRSMARISTCNSLELS
jgi:hypothetical protein